MEDKKRNILSDESYDIKKTQSKLFYKDSHRNKLINGCRVVAWRGVRYEST